MHQAGRSVEGPQRALELPLPAVCLRERERRFLVHRHERGQRPQSFTFGRGLLDRPGEGRKRTARGGSPDVVLGEQGAHLVPERARLARSAFVARRLADEIEPPCRPRAGRVEQVTVALDGIRLGEPRATQAAVELTRGLFVEERRRLATVRQRALLEAEDESDLVAARSHAQEIDDVNPAAGHALVTAGADGSPLQGADDLIRGQRAAEREPALELDSKPRHGVEGAKILLRLLTDGWRVEAVGGAKHETPEIPRRSEGRFRVPDELERRQRVAVAEPHSLFLRPLARLDGAPAKPSLDPVDARARETRVRRAQVAVEISAVAALQGETQQREQRPAELGLLEPDPSLDRVWHTE